jgi:lipopolysaccharide transport system permease protein
MLDPKFRLQLFVSLVARDLKVRYERSILGFFWALLQPVATFGIYYFVFSVVVKMKIENYWAFLLSGLILWQFISTALTGATNCIHANRSLIRKMPLPPENFVYGAVGARGMEFLFELTVCLTLFGYFLDVSIWRILPFLLVMVFFTMVFSAGLALPIASGSVYFPDLGHAVPIVLRLLFFVCPIFYARHSVPKKYALIYSLNPINMYLENFRLLAYEGIIPAPAQFLWMGLVAVAVFAVGSIIFRKTCRYFAEIL